MTQIWKKGLETFDHKTLIPVLNDYNFEKLDNPGLLQLGKKESPSLCSLSFSVLLSANTVLFVLSLSLE